MRKRGKALPGAFGQQTKRSTSPWAPSPPATPCLRRQLKDLGEVGNALIGAAVLLVIVLINKALSHL